MAPVGNLTTCHYCGADNPEGLEACQVCDTPLRSGRQGAARTMAVIDRIRVLMTVAVAVAITLQLVVHPIDIEDLVRGVAAPYRFDPTYGVPAVDQIQGTGIEPRGDDCAGSRPRICVFGIGDGADELVGELADYLRDEQGLPVGVLPGIELAGVEAVPATILNDEREQLDSQGLIALMRRVYPLALERHVMLIGVTRHDMYNSELEHLRYLLTTRDVDPGLLAVISTARLEQESYGLERDHRLLVERLRKMALRDIGFLYLELLPSDDETSLLTGSLNSIGDLDALVDTLPKR